MIKLFSEMRPIGSAMMRSKVGPLLVAIQVAISLAILANAIFIVNLRLDSASRPSGIADEMNQFRVHVSNKRVMGHEEDIASQKQEAATIRAVPGVISVARTNSVPLSQSGSSSSVKLSEKQVTSTANPSYFVTPDSLVKTWGLKLVEGRDFQDGDYLEADPSISKRRHETSIVSQKLAEKLFPDSSSFIGKTFYFDSSPVRIIGVVEQLQTQGAQQRIDGEFTVIFPARVSNQVNDRYAVRTAPGQRDRVMRDVADALRKATTDAIHVDTRSVEEFRARRYRSEKSLAWMLLSVSALLIVVTSSGIVGMSTLWVAQRRKQIGVRRALGAQRLDVLRYFLTENWMISTGGIVLGTMLALALNQILMAQFELPKLPLMYLAFAPFVFWILGIFAVTAPAWRAAGISPAIATRSI